MVRMAMACVVCLAGSAFASVLEVDYSPAYNLIEVRINAHSTISVETARLRTPDGKAGLLGEYFDISRYKDSVLKSDRLEGELAYTRVDAQIDFNWGGSAPTAAFADDWFGARWTGKVGPFPLAVRLLTVSDDGVRLWIDGEKVIDDWTEHALKADYADKMLEAGRVYDVRLEYFEAGGGAICVFAYQLPQKVIEGIDSAEVRLVAPGGKEVLKKQIQLEGKRGQLQFDVAGLPGGTYTVAAKLPGVPEPITRKVALRGAAPLARVNVAKGSYSGTFTVAGGAKFTVQPPLVRVESDRYTVEFTDMGISQIIDRKTGRKYCRPDGATPGKNAALFLKTYLPGQPDPTFFHIPEEKDEQRTNVRRIERGVEYTVSGLVCPGDEKTRRYNPEAMLGLRIEYLADTGDLALTVLANAGVPERFGAYDTGIFAAGFNVGPFEYDSIKLINPAGMPAPVSSFKGWEAWWPTGYPVSLMVFEAPGGECVAVWADDEQLEYGKKFRIDNGTVQFQTVNGDAPWRVGAMQAPIWRLNLFDSWEPAALRYREVMERTLGVKKLEEREPARARTIRLITHEVWGIDNFKRYYVDKGVPVEALMEWETQGWLAGYGVEVLGPKHRLWYPNYPYDRPTHYLGRPDFGKRTKERQDFGVPIFPYTLMFYGMSQPFEKDSRVLRAPGMDFTGGGRMWWVLYSNMMEELADRYGLQGIYNDCSWVGPQYDPRGKVDGLTVWQAHVQGRRYMRDRLLPAAFMGERQHEITIVSDFIALLWFMGEMHPINHYLFGPYTLRFNQRETVEMGAWVGRGRTNTKPIHRMLDASESLSVIPHVSNNRPLNMPARQETALINKRMLFWGQQMLTPYFPERYEPGVLAYLRGKDGTEYRTRSGDGMGLVRLRNGKEEIVWWRTKNVSEFDRKGAAIDGWVAYDGDRIIGLNPDNRYVVLEDATRPAVTISSLPKGAFLSLSRVEDDYWVAAVGGKELPDKVELTVSSGGKRLTFIGADVLDGPTAAGTYRIRVGGDSMFAACWGRAPQAITKLPAKLGAPASRMEFVGEVGLPVLSNKLEPAAGNGTLWWRSNLKAHSLQADYLLTLPKTSAILKAVAADDGKLKAATVRVRVNGKIIAEARHKGGERTPLQASLAEFAGQTVLLTFDSSADGNLCIRGAELVAAK